MSRYFSAVTKESQISRSAARRRGSDGKTVEAQVTRKHVLLRDWAPVGKISGGKWTAEVSALPAGGPTRIDLRVSGSPTAAAVNNILVGDLWMLAGIQHGRRRRPGRCGNAS
jgi:hypothetical protein